MNTYYIYKCGLGSMNISTFSWKQIISILLIINGMGSSIVINCSLLSSKTIFGAGFSGKKIRCNQRGTISPEYKKL